MNDTLESLLACAGIIAILAGSFITGYVCGSDEALKQCANYPSHFMRRAQNLTDLRGNHYPNLEKE